MSESVQDVIKVQRLRRTRCADITGEAAYFTVVEVPVHFFDSPTVMAAAHALAKALDAYYGDDR